MKSARELFSAQRLNWLQDENIRPYVFVRSESRIDNPGASHAQLDWFRQSPIYKNPLMMDEVAFANRILHLESRAFGPSGMAMPRWVFYDCALVPGFVAGYAARTSSLSPALKRAIEVDDHVEWTPLSLFIIIPTMLKGGEWVAHNLCSVNSFLPKDHQFYGIGFISKAFGLWYANVKTCCGMTQWTSPAVRLHAHYGDFEVLTAYTPVHSYARTLTYRAKVDPMAWYRFFTKEEDRTFDSRFSPAGFEVDPVDENSLISFQRRLESGEGPYFLNPQETLIKQLDQPLTIYQKK